MKVVLLSVSIPDICLPEELVPAIYKAVHSYPHLTAHNEFFVRILEAYLVETVLEPKATIREEPPHTKKAS